MDDLFEYDEHDGGNDAAGSRCEGAEESEDGDGESRPARVNTQWGEEDGNEAGGNTSQEEGKHLSGSALLIRGRKWRSGE